MLKIFLSITLVITTMEAQNSNKYQLATFGMGCFWCTEAIFQELKGVIKVTPGYAGGHKENPTYEEVCEGNTGHTEVTQIVFDPTQISYAELLEVFFKVHDPTTLNRQGNDVGYQYRSVIFYHNEEQKKLAEYYKQKLNEEKVYDNPIVTAIEPFTNFYPAENYHKNYYKLNSNKPYCQLVIKPKVEKFEKIFRDKLKK
jgi:peptide-methionine (S)-S-oxide reductase